MRLAIEAMPEQVNLYKMTTIHEIDEINQKSEKVFYETSPGPLCHHFLSESLKRPLKNVHRLRMKEIPFQIV